MRSSGNFLKSLEQPTFIQNSLMELMLFRFKNNLFENPYSDNCSGRLVFINKGLTFLCSEWSNLLEMAQIHLISVYYGKNLSMQKISSNESSTDELWASKVCFIKGLFQKLYLVFYFYNFRCPELAPVFKNHNSI